MGLLTVFYAPEKLFAEQGKEGKWLLPLVAGMIATVVFFLISASMIDFGAIAREQIESMPRVAEAMGPEKINEAVQSARSPAAKIRNAILAPVMGAVGVLIIAGLLFGLAAMVDAGTTFRRVLTVSAYASFAYGLVSGLGGVLVLVMMGDTTGVDVYNLVKLNPTLFLDRTTTSKPLYSLAASLDLLSFWRLFLLGLGLSKVSARLSIGKGVALAAAPWALWILLKMGWAAIF